MPSKTESFFETCVYITIILFVFTLLFNAIMSLGIYTTLTHPSGIDLDGNISDLIKDMTVSTQYSKGIVIENLWSVVLLGGLGGVGLAIVTQSASILGIYIFCFFFWGSYGNLLSILSIGGFLTGGLWAFVIIGTGAVTILFVAAIVGMLSGSG